MKRYIKKLLREGLLSEVTDEIHELIRRKYSNSRIVITDEDEIEFRPVVQDQNARPSSKPEGLWYGIGASWLDWIKDEMPEKNKANAFLLDIDDSKILRISSNEELLAFHERYSYRIYHGELYDELIMWDVVSFDYGGIEIAPYLWDMRMDDRVEWYYGWQIASGCIWGSGVIKKIERIN